MIFYHATDYKNMNNIFVNGIKRGPEGFIYLCKNPDEAARFIVIRGVRKIVSIAVDIDGRKVKESHDHNEAFFKCKAYTYNNDISASQIVLEECIKYDLDNK